MSVWKRNAVIVAIVLFVGAAVYLNWSYNKGEAAAADADPDQTAKILGQASLVSGDDGEGILQTGTEELDVKEIVSGYFATARLNRQQARDNALELLQQAAEDTQADQNMIDEANASIQTMAAYTLAEAQIENLIVAKGYADCICFIDESSASVVVSATESGLNDGDVARIAEIVHEETGLAVSQVKIIEAEP